MRKTFLLLLALLSGLFSFGQWQTLNPVPTHRKITKIAIASVQEAFVLAENGDLFRLAQPGGTPMLLRHFPGAFSMDFQGRTGVVGGWGDALYSTRDGGATWTTSFFNYLFSSSDAHFSHLQVLAGDTLLAVDNNHSTLHRSYDGGRTWTDSVFHIMLNNVLQFHFVDARTGFVARYDGLHRTRDGGRTWQQVNPGTGIGERAVRFVDRDHGMLFQGGTILRTTDGGDTWTNSLTVFSDIESFSYDGPDTVYAVAEYSRLYRSLDGGATWTDISEAPAYQSGGFASVAFRQGVGYGAGWSGKLAYSADAGSSWRAYGAFYQNVQALQLPGGDRAYAVTDTAVYRSDDRGLTWTALPIPRYPSRGFTHAWFTSPDTGIVFTKEQLQQLRTTDGGATWTRTNILPFGFDGLSLVDVVNDSTAYIDVAITGGGPLLRSSDRGVSWQPVAVPAGATRFDFVDARTGFALAGHSIWRSTDSSRTWQELYTDPNISPGGIRFLNASTGYLFGYNGLLRKTSDGGSTWTTQPVPPTHVDDVFFFNDRYGYLWGEQSGLYRTFDGGQTWHPDRDANYRLPARAFTPDSLLYIGGFGGAVMRAPVKGILQDSLLLTERTSCSARLNSWVSAAFTSVDGIWFEYGTRAFSNTLPGTPFSVANGSVRSSVALPDLMADSFYRVRVKVLSGGQVYYSPHLSFRTYALPKPIIFPRNDTLFSSYWTGNQWYRDGMLIPGATDRFLVPAQHGRYTVRATESGCLSPESEEQEARAAVPPELVRLYPNPAREWLHVTLTHNMPLPYELRTIGGTSLRSGLLRPGSNRIALHGVAPGVYLLAVSGTDGGGPRVRKVVVQ